jgi:glycosyltransferase involved in cell wall biosynthesis
MPAITFAIPFYRNRDYLECAIRSVLAQSSSDWELVISDDAGPEGDLASWIESFPHQDKIRYVRQSRNLGIAGNWNACLGLAAADLVTLLHADDELEPTYAEAMIAAAQRHPEASVVFCRAAVIDAAGRAVFSFPDWYKRWLVPSLKREFSVRGEDGLRSVFKGNFIMCPTMCYRRRDLPEISFDARWRQVLDLDFIARILLEGRQLIGLPAICYRYRRHESNQTKLQSDSLLRFEEERDLYLESADQAAARGWLRAAATCRRLAIVKLNLAYCIAQDLLTLRARHAMKKCRLLAKLVFRR